VISAKRSIGETASGRNADPLTRRPVVYFKYRLEGNSNISGVSGWQRAGWKVVSRLTGGPVLQLTPPVVFRREGQRREARYELLTAGSRNGGSEGSAPTHRPADPADTEGRRDSCPLTTPGSLILF